MLDRDKMWLEYKNKGLEDGTIIRRVVCAANRLGDVIVCGPRHFDPTMNKIIRILKTTDGFPEGERWEGGFVDQWGEWMDRPEALAVARASKQSTREDLSDPDKKYLYSEDLY